MHQIVRFDSRNATSHRNDPLIDNLTKRLVGIVNRAHRTENPFIKKTCRCGLPVLGPVYSYDDTTIGPGAIHFIACHRDEVTHHDIAWLEKEWGIIGHAPTSEQIGLPAGTF